MPKLSDAIQLANDRPTSVNDDLYQWAIDAEETIRKQDEIIELAYDIAQKFRTKVHTGMAKSVETYDDCTKLVKIITLQRNGYE